MTSAEYRECFKKKKLVKYKGKLYQATGMMSIRRNNEIINSVKISEIDSKAEYWVTVDEIERATNE